MSGLLSSKLELCNVRRSSRRWRLLILIPALAFAGLLGLGSLAYFSQGNPVQEPPGADVTHTLTCPVTGASVATNRAMVESSTTGQQEPQTELYTCPMGTHADVVFDHPGACPKCGMTLVPTSHVSHGATAEAAWLKNQSSSPATQSLGVAQLLRDHTGSLNVDHSTAQPASDTCGSCGMTEAQMAAGADCSHTH